MFIASFYEVEPICRHGRRSDVLKMTRSEARSRAFYMFMRPTEEYFKLTLFTILSAEAFEFGGRVRSY